MAEDVRLHVKSEKVGVIFGQKVGVVAKKEWVVEDVRSRVKIWKKWELLLGKKVGVVARKERVVEDARSRVLIWKKLELLLGK